MRDKTRLEINVRRLLSQCEILAKEDLNIDWKLEMYIEALQDMIEKLQTTSGKPSRDVMVKYIKRVEFLKSVLNTKKLSTPVERAVAAQLLPVNIVLPHEATDGPSITTEIHNKTTSKYGQEIRNELFKSSLIDSGGIKHRTNHSNGQEQNLEHILNYNRNMQEKIAENMIIMTRNIKEHALTASEIIKNDVTMLEKTDKLTDNNSTKLKGESSKLEEHTKSTWRCWLWLMIAFVLVVFFNMVLFMKVAKKKVH